MQDPDGPTAIRFETWLITLQGLTPVGSSSAEFAERVRKEHALWGKVIREAGIRLD